MGAAVEVDPHFPALPHAAEEMQSVPQAFSCAEVKSSPEQTPRHMRTSRVLQVITNTLLCYARYIE